jgi:hypothetical protein
MKEIFKLIPAALYFLVGIVSLIMALKSFFSKKILPFQEKAAGKVWDKIENPIKILMLFFLRMSGLGFLVISVLLIAFSIINLLNPVMIYEYLIPVIALIYTFGLFINNYFLFKFTKAGTPWKESLYVMLILITGIIISIFN